MALPRVAGSAPRCRASEAAPCAASGCDTAPASRNFFTENASAFGTWSCMTFEGPVVATPAVS